MNTVTWLASLSSVSQIMQVDPLVCEYWQALQLQLILGYSQWRSIEEAIASWLRKTLLFDNLSSGSTLCNLELKWVTRLLCINAHPGDG